MQRYRQSHPVLRGMQAVPMLAALVLVLALAPGAGAQPPGAYRFAVVALADDPVLRETFEDGLVAKLRARGFDAVTSYDVVPDIEDADKRNFVRRLLRADDEIAGILMMRPAAVGPGASLDAVRDEIRDDVFRDMQAFADAVSTTGTDDLIAVIHLGIYMLADDDDTIPLSAGAVWLDEPVNDTDEAVARLQDLIVGNLDAARPSIREFLGLPPR